MKNASEHFSLLITRLTMVVYLYNVKYFFVVKKGAKEVWAIKLEKNKYMNHLNWGGGGEDHGREEGLSLLNFILMKWNFVTYCS